MIRKCFFVCCLIICGSFVSEAQNATQIEILNANTFEGDETLGKNVSRLLGDVRFRHKNAIMWCDSAILYQLSNSLDAFGNIRITQGDSIELTGNWLKYDGNTGIAVVNDDVVLRDRQMTLTSDNLSYNLENETGSFVNGGRIVDLENVLTSEHGVYHSATGTVHFRNNVILDNPSYYLTSDTLAYNNFNSIASFFGPTFIHSKDRDSSLMYCEEGWYNTESGRSSFTRNAYIRTGPRFISADSLLYDKTSAFGEGFGSVAITDTVERLSITGDYGYSDDLRKEALVTGSALLMRHFEEDTLYMHGDTLYASEDTITGSKSWKAFHGVRFFKTDLSGKCDSVSYDEADSLLKFFKDPVIWSNENQLTADSIMLRLSGNDIQYLEMRGNSFICSSEDSTRFNQVKGRDMTGHFTENELTSIYVSGNGQSIYYTRNSNNQVTGVNRAECSDMFITVNQRRINEISLIDMPDATLFPPEELSSKELKLKGFRWRSVERPLSPYDVY